MKNLKKMLAVLLAAAMMLAAVPALGESAAASTTNDQRLDAAYTLALNAINAEDYATAKEYLDICFAYCDRQSNPVLFADLLLKRACINVIEEKYDLALLALDACLQVQPDLADAWLVLSQIYITQNDYSRAAASLEKYVELSGETSLYETIAQLYESMGANAEAQAAYEKYAEAAGTGNKETVYQLGLYKMQNGDLEGAIADFQTCAEDETYGAGAWYNIGVCKLNQGDYAGAQEAFETCESKGGNFSGIYYNRGLCAFLQEKWEEAAADFQKSLDNEPFVDDARYNLAVCQMQMEDYAKAVETFTVLIGDGEAAVTEETATEGTDTATEGGESAEAAPADEERQVNPAAYYFRGVCNFALGNLETALQDFTYCIDQGYELGQSYQQRAQVYAAMGDTEKQNADLENYLKNAN